MSQPDGALASVPNEDDGGGKWLQSDSATGRTEGRRQGAGQPADGGGDATDADPWEDASAGSAPTGTAARKSPVSNGSTKTTPATSSQQSSAGTRSNAGSSSSSGQNAKSGGDTAKKSGGTTTQQNKSTTQQNKSSGTTTQQNKSGGSTTQQNTAQTSSTNGGTSSSTSSGNTAAKSTVQVTYTFVGQSAGTTSYVSKLLVRNTGTNLSSWTIELPVGGKVVAVNGGVSWRQEGTTLVITSSRELGAGKTLELTLVADGTPQTPTQCTLQGSQCTIA